MKSPEGGPATLASAIRAGLDIMAVCLECQHSSVLSSAELAKWLGHEFVVRRLIERLRCQECNSKQVDLIMHNPHGNGAIAGHGPSRAS